MQMDARRLLLFGQTSDGTGFVGSIANIERQNLPPRVEAGGDLAVDPGDIVTLYGTGFDPEGGTISYTWSQTAGTSVTLEDDGTAMASFVAPRTTATQTLTFQLAVTDGHGETGTDTVDVTVQGQSITVQGGGRGGFVAAAHLVHFEETGSAVQVTVWGSNVRDSGLIGAIHVPGTDIMVNLVSSPRTDYPLDTTVAGHHRILEGTIPAVPDAFFVSIGDENNFVGTFKSTLVRIESGIDSGYVETGYHESMTVSVPAGQNHYVLPWE